LLFRPAAPAQAADITFTKSAAKVDAYYFIELMIAVKGPTAKNPFTDVGIDGQFNPEGRLRRTTVIGLCS
jgi:hypothetical protein